MTTTTRTERRGWWVALVVASLLLVGSVSAVLAWSVARAPAWGTTRAGGAWADGPASVVGGRMMRGGMWGTGGTAYTLPGSGPVTQAEAALVARTWVDRFAPGATLDAGVAMPMGYRFTAARDGQTVAVVLVDDDTGSVTGRLFVPARPAPTATPTPSTTTG